jgi:hypothetical protein
MEVASITNVRESRLMPVIAVVDYDMGTCTLPAKVWRKLVQRLK